MAAPTTDPRRRPARGNPTAATAQRLVPVAYRSAARAARLLPEPAFPAVTAVAGALAMALMPRRRAMVQRHLRRVRGPGLGGWQLRVAAWRALRSYALYWLDTFRSPALGADRVRHRLEADGLEHLDRALAAGTGAVLATPHLGSWDLGGAWLAGRGYPLVVVMERLRPPKLLDWFRAERERLGMEVVVRDRDVWEHLDAALSANKVVVLVCDRDLSGRGVPVELFGERTTLPRGPAVLARRCGAALLPVAVYDLDHRRHRGVVRPPVPVARTGDEAADVASTTRRLAREIEGLVRRAPEQWHLLAPNWPSDRTQVASR